MTLRFLRARRERTYQEIRELLDIRCGPWWDEVVANARRNREDVEQYLAERGVLVAGASGGGSENGVQVADGLGELRDGSGELGDVRSVFGVHRGILARARDWFKGAA